MTVRDAIEGQYSLEAAKNDDGTYTVPSAEVVISDVRNELLVADAEQRGIEVSEDEMAEYAEDTLGVSDFETLAEQYQIDEDQAARSCARMRSSTSSMSRSCPMRRL